jgi:hypothetical protein
MARQGAAGAKMRHRVSRELYAYWDSLRGARAAPDRGDIDPASIRHVLADTFILEVDSACTFPMRLCGSRLNALRGDDQKGVSFLDMWRDQERRDVAAALLTVIDGATPIVGGARTGPDPGNSFVADWATQEMDLELLLLPLRHFGKTHSRLLGSLAAFGSPRWFGRDRAAPLELVSMRIIRAPEQEGLHGLAPSFRPPGASTRAAPRLVVYEGGKSRR